MQTKQEHKDYEYSGDKLRTHMADILSNPEVAKRLGEKSTIKPQEAKPIMFQKTKAEQTIVVPKIKPKPKAKVRVGYKKISVTIPERIWRYGLNYAGHSSKKEATIPVFVKGDVAEVDDDPDTVLPVYPLSSLEHR